MISTGGKTSGQDRAADQPGTLFTVPEVYSNLPKEATATPNYHAEEKRKNDKNKFINKLKQLHGSGGSDLPTLHRSYPSLSESVPSNRRQRNKIAARQSRDRKKLYVKLMETKIDNLQMEMMQTLEEIEQLRLDIFNVEMRQCEQTNQGKQIKQNKQVHIIKKLEGLLSSQDIEERNNQINICLDSIIYRIGALGNERKAALQKLYQDLLKFSQPALYRYIMWTAVQKTHIFKETQTAEEEEWCREAEQVSRAVIKTAREKGADLIGIGSKIASHNESFQKCEQDLERFRGVIEKKGQLLDNVFNDIREVLTPDQVANLILFVERYQFKKEVRLFEEEDLGRPNKKIKQEFISDDIQN